MGAGQGGEGALQAAVQMSSEASGRPWPVFVFVARLQMGRNPRRRTSEAPGFGRNARGRACRRASGSACPAVSEESPNCLTRRDPLIPFRPVPRQLGDAARLHQASARLRPPLPRPRLPEVDPQEVNGLGFLLGAKKAGPFKIEVEWITLVRAGAAK
jgi:hypothetical protein